jgi:hAT family C-terminal dimerisation region
MKCGEKSVFRYLLNFVNLIMTLPVSSAEAERTFSTLKGLRIIYARQWVMKL